MMTYASVVEPLRAANLLSKNLLYRISHIATTGTNPVSSSGAIVKSNFQPRKVVDFDLVIVIAGGDPLSVDDANLF